MAVSADLTVPLGDTWRSKRWALVVSGAVVDLSSGWTVRAQVRHPGRAGALLHEWTVPGGGIEFGTAEFLLDGLTVTGTTVRLRVTAPESQAMTGWAGVWDLEVSHPSFDAGALYRKTLVAGYARTVNDTTR